MSALDNAFCSLVAVAFDVELGVGASNDNAAGQVTPQAKMCQKLTPSP